MESADVRYLRTSCFDKRNVRGFASEWVLWKKLVRKYRTKTLFMMKLVFVYYIQTETFLKLKMIYEIAVTSTHVVLKAL